MIVICITFTQSKLHYTLGQTISAHWQRILFHKKNYIESRIILYPQIVTQQKQILFWMVTIQILKKSSFHTFLFIQRYMAMAFQEQPEYHKLKTQVRFNKIWGNIKIDMMKINNNCCCSIKYMFLISKIKFECIIIF